MWENDPPLPTVMEHPQTVAEDNNCSASYSSFSGNADSSANVYNNTDNSQNRKEAETTELSFRYACYLILIFVLPRKGQGRDSLGKRFFCVEKLIINKKKIASNR